MLTTKDIAWVAGILEGEGSFGLTNNGRNPIIYLGMTDKDIVERFRDIVQGDKGINISEDNRKETYKTSYRLTLNGHTAVGWMMTIYPLMGNRRKQKIREVLDTWRDIKLNYSQVRDMSPQRKTVLTLMSLGLTEEQAKSKLNEMLKQRS